MTLLVPLALVGTVWGLAALTALATLPPVPGAPAAPPLPWSQSLAWGGVLTLVAAGAAALAVARRAAHVVAGMALLACALGTMRATSALAGGAPSPLERRLAAGPVAALRGVVAAPPVPRERAQRLRLRVTAVRAPGASPWEALTGSVQVTARPSPALHAGDELEVRGAPQAPEAGTPAGYAAVLRRQGIDAVVAFPALTRLGHRTAAGPWGDAAERLRVALAGGLESLLPEPQASLAAGILLGQGRALPPLLQEQLARSGTSHVVAVSGYNVGLVVAVAGTVAGRAGRTRRHRRAAVVLASLALWAFVALVGPSGSVLRAGAMAQLALAGRAFERESAAGGLLLWASAALLAWRPDLALDAGWQLSFLGTAGLVWLGPALAARLSALPLTVREALGATLAAQLFVLPALAVTFGRVSLVAPLSNVLVLPLVGPVMLGAALTSAAALLCPPLAPLLAGLTWAPATALLEVIAWTASLPFAAATLPEWSPGAVIAYLAALVAICAAREWRADAVVARPAPGSPPAGRQDALVCALLALSAVGCAMAAPYSPAAPPPELHLTVPTVPTGTLALAVAPDGARLLLGGGPTTGGAAALLGDSLRPWDRALDAALIADPRDTHLQGLLRVVGRYRTGVLLDGASDRDPDRYPALRDTLSAAGARNVPHRTLASGDSARIGPDLRLTALGAPARPSWRLEWVGSEFSLLLPGDLRPAAAAGPAPPGAGLDLPPSDVLLLDAAGAADPALAALLRAVRPAFVVLQGNPDRRDSGLVRLALAAPAAERLDAPAPPALWHDTARDGPLRLDVRPEAFRLNGGPWIPRRPHRSSRARRPHRGRARRAAGRLNSPAAAPSRRAPPAPSPGATGAGGTAPAGRRPGGRAPPSSRASAPPRRTAAGRAAPRRRPRRARAPPRSRPLRARSHVAG
jgi:competence protein ComEC